VERRFDGESLVQAVYDWVDTLKSMEHVHYSLLTSFPRVVYGPDKRQMTMKEAGLHPRAGLFVKVDED
jgi:FAS-associated factor 2